MVERAVINNPEEVQAVLSATSGGYDTRLEGPAGGLSYAELLSHRITLCRQELHQLALKEHAIAE